MPCTTPRLVRAALPALLGLAVAACDDGPEAALPDAGPTGDYVPLIAAHWTLVPGDEGYLCATRTLSEDVYVGAIRPIGPPGTHHTTVALQQPNGPDDPGSPCGVSFGSFYVSGNGTGELVLPDGVALVAKKGQQLALNLHLFNATDGMLSGTSGVEVKLVDPAQVQHEARVTLHGPHALEIPADGQPFTLQASEALVPQTVVAVFPHMHQLGTHFKAVIVQDGTPTTIWDDAYQFESQEFAAIAPLIVGDGAALETTCTWVNSTGVPVTWGDSSTAEMCFTILMSY